MESDGFSDPVKADKGFPQFLVAIPVLRSVVDLVGSLRPNEGAESQTTYCIVDVETFVVCFWP